MMLRLFSCACSLAVAATAALADEARTTTTLPGVTGGHSIVAPMPEPPQPADGSATKRVGKWELTVSGYVWVQVGASGSVRGD